MLSISKFQEIRTCHVWFPSWFFENNCPLNNSPLDESCFHPYLSNIIKIVWIKSVFYWLDYIFFQSYWWLKELHREGAPPIGQGVPALWKKEEEEVEVTVVESETNDICGYGSCTTEGCLKDKLKRVLVSGSHMDKRMRLFLTAKGCGALETRVFRLNEALGERISSKYLF